MWQDCVANFLDIVIGVWKKQLENIEKEMIKVSVMSARPSATLWNNDIDKKLLPPSLQRESGKRNTLGGWEMADSSVSYCLVTWDICL